MFRFRIFCLALALGCVPVLGASAAQTHCDGSYCFAAEDFSPEEALTGICITDLPKAEGTLYLGTRILQSGDILTADQVRRMTFAPADSEADRVAAIGYLPVYGDSVGEEAVMTLSIPGKTDKAPIAEDLALETYKNLPAEGTLKVTDPEGKALTFTVTRQPRRGTVEIREDGSFTYTPKKNKVGVDSFVYTAADPAGKVSREATVTVTILKPTDKNQYQDTLGRDCRFAAEWMRHTGIFAGENLAQESCFSPDRELTRGEFTAMLVKTLEIPVEEGLVYTGYADEIPTWLQPYVAAAVRAGLTAGLEEPKTFRPDAVITAAEARTMVSNALNTAETFAEGEDAPLTRGQAAQLLYRTAKELAARDTTL